MNKKAFWWLLLTAGIITLLHFLFHPIRVLYMDTSIFYMDEKITLAAFFTIVLYFTTSFLVFSRIVPTVEKLKWNWLGLGIFFILLSLDEYLEIHEALNSWIKMNVSKETLLADLSNFNWIFPLFFIVLLVFVLLARLVLREKGEGIQKLLAIGMVIYAMVLVFELAGSALYGSPLYLVSVGIEEGLEMAAAAVFLLAVLEKSSQLQSSYKNHKNS